MGRLGRLRAPSSFSIEREPFLRQIRFLAAYHGDSSPIPFQQVLKFGCSFSWPPHGPPSHPHRDTLIFFSGNLAFSLLPLFSLSDFGMDFLPYSRFCKTSYLPGVPPLGTLYVIALGDCVGVAVVFFRVSHPFYTYLLPRLVLAPVCRFAFLS